MINKRTVLAYFILLFLLLGFIYFPSFFDPPRSDAWPTFYFFHHLDTLPGSLKWLHVINFDPLHQVNFYPLAHSFVYFQHCVFGPAFIYSHLLHFAFYCMFIIILYRFALIFFPDKKLILALIGIFTFLFSHFDIITWSHHTHVIFAFSLFLAGFMSYAKFLKSGKVTSLFWSAILCLWAMLHYFPFVLWPLGIIILSYNPGLVNRAVFTRAKLILSYLFALGFIYIFYAVIFFMTRSIPTYQHPLITFGGLLAPKEILLTFAYIAFNLLYDGLLINLLPLLAAPGGINDNVFEIGGPLAALEETAVLKLIIAAGVILLVCLVMGFRYLKLRKNREAISTLSFFVFLLFSETFILFRLRLITNNIYYNFQQFRYQYIINVFIVLIVLLVLTRVFKLTQSGRRAVFFFLPLILAVNIYSSWQGRVFVTDQLKPLKTLIQNIKEGIRDGRVNPGARLYLDDSIVENLPALCWNRYMGSRYMQGTYQWLFNKNEIQLFVFRQDDAKWVIDTQSLALDEK